MIRCAHCDANAVYRCAVTGAPVCLAHARLVVVGPGALPLAAAGAAVIRPVSPADIYQAQRDRSAIESLALHFWGETEVDCFGQTYDVLALPAWVAEVEGAMVGCLVYAIERDVMTVVMLNVLPAHQGQGAGSGLIRAAIDAARARRLTAVRVATTNDDLPALALYQRHGFRLTGLLPGLVAVHHSEELVGFSGIPVRDEVQLVLSIH
ncbi:MAG: GNAT family N-acetyltransferase [Chloroflexi bacterium]|nr:GNAT family N-acetyltransferase [Chloroflexota bacterium]MBU1751610.1 GNAT family N-acetyltransferase [Chloroflexota bacterium]MBU1879838.1 GNAT family N-acetyltransferase [Chloroflexota bacterium]